MPASAPTAAQRYETLKPQRDPFLIRARQCAALTVPYLCPPAGFSAHQQLPTPYQGLGARGVRTLSSKLLLATFPANTPFFKYSIDDLTLRNLEEQSGQGGLRGEVEKALSARERAVVQEMETALFRITASAAFQHLLVAGNVLVHIPQENERSRLFRLDQYVVRRAPDGTLLELVIEEYVSPQSLDPAIAAQIEATYDPAAPDDTADKHHRLYTHVLRDQENGLWRVYQEMEGIRLAGTAGTYPLDELPWLPLRLSTQPGEDYGRSYVEEFLGDLDSLEGLVESIVEGSAAIARVVFLVSPNGTTNIRLVSRARTGDTIPGEANDVTTIQAQKQADLGVARQQAQEIAQSLAFSFMLNTAIQRQGERVTAEEIRYMAAELDTALGGMYTLLGAEFQLPAVRAFERRMERSRKVPKLPEGSVRPVIVTGLEAIGRGQDQRNLRLWVEEIIQVIGPELAFKKLVLDEFLKRSAANYGIDTEGLILSEEEVQQQEMMQMVMQLVEQLGPEGIRQLGGMAQTGMKVGAAQPQETQ